MEMKTAMAVVVELLENNGFRVSDVREERTIRTDTGHVIDDRGTAATGAILLRAIPKEPEDVQ